MICGSEFCRSETGNDRFLSQSVNVNDNIFDVLSFINVVKIIGDYAEGLNTC